MWRALAYAAATVVKVPAVLQAHEGPHPHADEGPMERDPQQPLAIPGWLAVLSVCRLRHPNNMSCNGRLMEVRGSKNVLLLLREGGGCVRHHCDKVRTIEERIFFVKKNSFISAY